MCSSMALSCLFSESRVHPLWVLAPIACKSHPRAGGELVPVVLNQTVPGYRSRKETAVKQLNSQLVELEYVCRERQLNCIKDPPP